jgi:uncharacterized protein (TIGR02271 family)
VLRTTFGLFDDLSTAQRVAAALQQEGYPREGMSLLVPDPRGEHTNIAEPFSLTPLTISGIGPAAVGGRLGALLAQGDPAAGGFVGSLTHLGFSGPDARHYFESIRRGQILVAVESPEERRRRTEEIMRRFGARAVEETPSITGIGTEARAPEHEGMMDEVTVPVVEEQLEVQKRQVNRGGVRINSQIVEQPIQESVRLREERVSVERRPVNRDATEAELLDFKEGSIEIHETVEEPVISKRRRVVEEIVVGKELRERTETISETIRKTQVHVENLADTAAGSRPEYREEVRENGARERGVGPGDRADFRDDIRENRGRETPISPISRPESREKPLDAPGLNRRRGPAVDRPEGQDVRESGVRDRGARPPLDRPDRDHILERLRREEGLDEYDPAYRYGSSLAGDERYRRAEWSDVEPHARREWEEEHAGTWEQFKDAVRHAWEKVSGR